MIEFNGSYFQYAAGTGLPVLVQFDGAELIVWHVPDPFCRLAAYGTFRITVSRDQQRRSINFPNGARIDTSDDIVDSLIDEQCKSAGQRNLRRSWTAAALTLFALMIMLAFYFALSDSAGFPGI